ncbi:MAG: hypothetical protein P0S93_05365 [Candidatus Neptunochlamydia sp.]|nr:hypothetical protein [Candidatus Neptunochlamydia sp.]
MPIHQLIFDKWYNHLIFKSRSSGKQEKRQGKKSFLFTISLRDKHRFSEEVF